MMDFNTWKTLKLAYIGFYIQTLHIFLRGREGCSIIKNTFLPPLLQKLKTSHQWVLFMLRVLGDDGGGVHRSEIMDFRMFAVNEMDID